MDDIVNNMDDTVNNSAVDKIAKLARSAAEIKTLGRKNRLIAVPEGVSVVSEESLLKPGLDRSVYIDRTEHVSNSQSFVDFVESYASNETVVFVDKARGTAQAILNYIPKSTLYIDPKQRNKPVNVEDVVAYRCDWQIIYQQSLSEQWAFFKSLTKPKLSARDKAMKLTALKSYFLQPYQDEDEAISFRGTDKTFLYPEILKADIATENDMLNLVFDRPLSAKRLVAYFSLPVHEGSSPMQITLFIENKAGKISFEIIDAESVVELSSQIGMSKVRAKLKSNYNVFDADLTNLDV